MRCRLLRSSGSVVTVDAATGFAHPAIDLGFERLFSSGSGAGRCGTGRAKFLQLRRVGLSRWPSGRSRSSGHWALRTRLPRSRLRAVRNLWSAPTRFPLLAPDGIGGAAILIDQSASTIAKSEVMKHAREGRSLPEGWALDPDGNPTTDPDAGLKGSMAPSGGYKGVGVAIFVELTCRRGSGRDARHRCKPVFWNFRRTAQDRPVFHCHRPRPDLRWTLRRLGFGG